MAAKVKAIPDGFHALTPYLTVRDAEAAMAFYRQAFGAVEVLRVPEPNGKRLMHAEVRIGDSVLMLGDTFPEFGGKNPEDLGGSAATVHLYCEDVDAVVAAATKAGATLTMPPAEMFWGDRYARLVDPFGHQWSIATHTRDLSEAEIAKGAALAFAQNPTGSS